MSAFTLVSPKLYLGEFDVSGDLSALALDYSADGIDNTCAGATAKTRLGGLKGVALSCQGYWQAGATPDLIDHILWDKFAVADTVATVCGQTGAAGEACSFFRADIAKYTVGASLGSMLAFSASGEASTGPLVLGTVMATGSKTSTAAGTGYGLGLLGAGQYAYAALHVISVSGTNPTLDVLIQSDVDADFGSPTTRFTFSQKTAIGSQWLTPLAGAVADDDFWRASWTIGGTNTPTFGIVVVLGIQ